MLNEIHPIALIACALGGYLLGSLSAAIIVCRLMGLPDPRTTGSGNPGATNVLRSGNKTAAALTLLGDALKGLLPPLVLVFAGLPSPLPELAAAGAFLGHLYPLYFGFRGGKGVATALGALFGLAWIAGLLAALTWMAVVLVFRISSLGALVSFALAPLYLWLLGAPSATVAAMALMAGLLYWRHRGNIQRILDGTESRVGRRA